MDNIFMKIALGAMILAVVCLVVAVSSALIVWISQLR